jgi:thioredoxin-related protein
MRKRGLILLFTILSLVPILAQQNIPGAGQILADGKRQAAAEHKNIFLIFGASWCGPCHRFDQFLEAPEVSAIIQKYFVVARLSIDEQYGKHPELNTPGGDELVTKFGGTKGGVPFLVFLDNNGGLIANSNRMKSHAADGGNIGYPDSPEEIDWFMTMLRRAVPSLPKDEAQVVEGWLRKASKHH